jgi:hypothetical protein
MLQIKKAFFCIFDEQCQGKDVVTSPCRKSAYIMINVFVTDAGILKGMK